MKIYKKIIFAFLLLTMLVLFCPGIYAEETEDVEIEDVIIPGGEGSDQDAENVDIDVDEATAARIRNAIGKADIFEENGVIVVETRPQDNTTQIDENGNEIEDSFVILPEKTIQDNNTLNNTLRSILPEETSDSIIKNILPKIEAAAKELYYFAFPVVVKTGAVLEDKLDGFSRKIMGLPPKTEQERADLYKRYNTFLPKKRPEKLQRMMVEINEFIEDESEKIIDRRKSNLEKIKSDLLDEFDFLYKSGEAKVIKIKKSIFIRHPHRFHKRKHFSHDIKRHKNPHFFKRRHRIHYLPAQYRHAHHRKVGKHSGIKKRNSLTKSVVFRSYKRSKSTTLKRAPVVRQTKIRMHKKRYHAKRSPVRSMRHR